MSRGFCLLVIFVGLLSLSLVPQPSRAFNPPLVAVQAGHWRSNELPDEFARLRGNSGASAGGVREVDLNIDIAHRIVEYLRAWGNEAYVLPATVPPRYRADAFVAIHSDGHTNTSARGYKIATYHRDWVASSTLVREIDDEYGKQTGLPRDWRITENMRDYYAFNSGLYEHTISEETPGAIVEMGFLSNRADRAFMVNNRDLIARSIALGIARFLGTRPAEGWSAPPLLPKDKVEVINNLVPLHEGPGKNFRLVERSSRGERYGVIERRDGWAKLFAYDGKERWIEEFQTRQIFIP
jgi:hypothetical protein